MRVQILFLTWALSYVAVAAAAQQPSQKTVTIGVLNDQSGPYADASGPGSTLAAQMAQEDSGLSKAGWTIHVIYADHQNKADLGANIARQWFDRDNVDAIVDVPNSAVAFAVSQVAREKNGVLLASGGAAAELTGKSCSPNTVQWTFDTWMLAHAMGRAVVQAGGKSWYFVSADYAFGTELERETAEEVTSLGGRIVGSAKAPLNTADFSSYLLQAQNSKAQVIGLANAGGDAVNSIKQAHEFGISSNGQRLAALVLQITEVHALGLDVAQGLELSETFYWDQNEETRSFSRRFYARMRKKAMPNMTQAGVYASVLHYLKALGALGGNPHDGAEVVAKMKAMPTDDPLFGHGNIRIDGRALHPAYVYRVKTPAESKGPWDYYKLMTTIPANEAFRPLDQGGCSLVK